MLDKIEVRQWIHALQANQRDGASCERAVGALQAFLLVIGDAPNWACALEMAQAGEPPAPAVEPAQPIERSRQDIETVINVLVGHRLQYCAGPLYDTSLGQLQGLYFALGHTMSDALTLAKGKLQEVGIDG